MISPQPIENLRSFPLHKLVPPDRPPPAAPWARFTEKGQAPPAPTASSRTSSESRADPGSMALAARDPGARLGRGRDDAWCPPWARFAGKEARPVVAPAFWHLSSASWARFAGFRVAVASAAPWHGVVFSQSGEVKPLIFRDFSRPSGRSVRLFRPISLTRPAAVHVPWAHSPKKMKGPARVPTTSSRTSGESRADPGSMAKAAPWIRRFACGSAGMTRGSPLHGLVSPENRHGPPRRPLSGPHPMLDKAQPNGVAYR